MPSERDRLSRSACMPRLDFQTVSRSSSQAATAARGSSAAPEWDWVANSSSKMRSAWAKPFLHVAALQRNRLAAHQVALSLP